MNLTNASRAARLRRAAHRATPIRIENLERRVMLSAVDVLTQHNDNSRTGENLSETTLNTTTVNVNNFGFLYTRPLDDQMYAQPLYVTGVSIPGKGTHDIVYAATVGDTVYAYDANDPTVTTPYWQDNFTNLAAGIRPVSNTDVGQNCGTYKDFSGNIGIVSTPVVDKATNTLFCLARTVENGVFIQRLHALDLSTGAEKPNSPMLIQATVPGTGAGSTNGIVTFNSQTENQRAALALDAGNVIITWASHCDTGPYHGWVMAYNETSLQQAWVSNVTPNGANGGIWQSGQGPAIDLAGNMYFTTGNGSDDATDFGEAFIKMSPTGQMLDYFIPNNFQALNNVDADLGSAGPLLIPGTNLITTGGKEGKMYLVDTTNMGHLNTPDQVVQEFQVTPSANNDHIHGSPIYYQDSSGNQWIYVWGMSDTLKQYAFNGATYTSTTPTHVSNVTIAPTPSQPGAMLSLSANGSSAGTGIVWSVSTLGPSANQAVQPGIFRAFDASNVSTELWNSQQNANRDDFGNLAKFNYVTVDNGHVYVPTFSNQLIVYGLLAGTPATPATLTATPANGKNEIDLSWAAVSGSTQYVIERKVGGATYLPLAIVNGAVTNYQDTTVTAGTVYSYKVRAQNAVGDSVPAVASAQAAFLQQQLVHLRFDEGTGTTTADSSGNANTGTLATGATWTSAGEISNALNFNGTTSAYVTVPNSASLNPQGSQISVTAWFKAIDWNGNRRILQKGPSDNQYRLTAEGGVFKFDLSGVGTVSITLPSINVWHNAVGTYDGTTMKLYIDGAVAGSLTVATPGAALAVTTGNLYIGTKINTATTAGDYFNGTIDDVRIYNYSLTAADVATLLTNTAPAAPTSMLATPTSASTMTVTFTDNANNESGFVLERKLAAGSYAVVAQLPANTTGGATTFIDSGLAANSTYTYRVRAYNVVDYSAYSNESSGQTQGVAINSLTAQWKFDESSGTSAADATGNQNTGTLFGNPAFATDTPDGSSHSLSLNGTSQFVRVNDSPYVEPTSAITLAAWVKSNDWSLTRGIISKGAREGSYYLIANNGLLTFNLSNQGTIVAPLPGTGVWHHVVGSYDGSTMKLYVDGRLVASHAATGLLAVSNDPLFIGGTADSLTTGLTFNGLIDDARVYNFALLPQQISAIYGNVATWKLDDTPGSLTAVDSSPNGNNLTLVNFPVWTSGIDNGALSFDGTTQYATANDNVSLNPTTAITLSAFVNASTWGGVPRILEKGSGAGLQYSLRVIGGNVQFALGGVATLSVPAPSVAVWHQITGTYDGAAMRLYVDGLQVGLLAASGPIATSGDPLYIATNSTFGGTMFQGRLDDIGIYSRALTAGEVGGLASILGHRVTQRSIFYNNSQLDGYNAAGDATDLANIDSSKHALIPGTGPASFANYTSDVSGINGIIVSIIGLSTITAGDFTFLAGNISDTTQWGLATPATVSIIATTPANQFVALTWPDGTLRNTWLEVIVNANTDTGLASPDIFFFGNLVGESGKGATGGVFSVTSADELAARNDPHGFTSPADISNPHDYNRDGRVDITDQMIARASNGHTLLQLAAPQSGFATPGAAAFALTATGPWIPAPVSTPVITPSDPVPPAPGKKKPAPRPRHRLERMKIVTSDSVKKARN